MKMFNGKNKILTFLPGERDSICFVG